MRTTEKKTYDLFLIIIIYPLNMTLYRSISNSITGLKNVPHSTSRSWDEYVCPFKCTAGAGRFCTTPGVSEKPNKSNWGETFFKNPNDFKCASKQCIQNLNNEGDLFLSIKKKKTTT